MRRTAKAIGQKEQGALDFENAVAPAPEPVWKYNVKIAGYFGLWYM